MSEQSSRYEQAAVDAVIAGDVSKLESALRRLAKTDAIHFSVIIRQLLSTEQKKTHTTMAIAGLTNTLPPFYYDFGVVYAAAYIDVDGFLAKQAFPSGKGIGHGRIVSVVEKVRTEHDEAVMKRVRELRAHIKDLANQMYGHSAADPGLLNLACSELMKGHALLIAAATPLE